MPAGEAVFHQGDPGDRFYVVVSGTAEVVGDGRPVASLGPGESFGEIALLRRVPRTATVRAVTDLRLETLRGGPVHRRDDGVPAWERRDVGPSRRDDGPVRAAGPGPDAGPTTAG